MTKYKFVLETYPGNAMEICTFRSKNPHAAKVVKIALEELYGYELQMKAQTWVKVK